MLWHRRVPSGGKIMLRLDSSELRNVVGEVVGPRAIALRKVTHGLSFEATLTRLGVGFAALPEALLNMPLADVLKGIDDDHDGWGRAIDHLMRAIEDGPKALATLLPVAELVRQHYMTKRTEIMAAYAVEDQLGQDRLKRLDSDAATLGAVPTPDARTLRDWIQEYAQAGTKLGVNLSGRAVELAGRSPVPGLATFSELRAELIGTIGKLRRQIESDLEHDAAAPRTLMNEVLGHLDEVVRLSEARAKTKRTATQEPPKVP